MFYSSNGDFIILDDVIEGLYQVDNDKQKFFKDSAQSIKDAKKAEAEAEKNCASKCQKCKKGRRSVYYRDKKKKGICKYYCSKRGYCGHTSGYKPKYGGTDCTNCKKLMDAKDILAKAEKERYKNSDYSKYLEHKINQNLMNIYIHLARALPKGETVKPVPNPDFSFEGGKPGSYW